MGEIQIDEDLKDTPGKLLYAKFQASSEPPSFIKFLIKKHIVKNEKQAELFTIILIIVILAISIFIFKKINEGPIIIDNVIKVTPTEQNQ